MISMVMKNNILIVFSVLSLTAASNSEAWNDRGYYPEFGYLPGSHGGYRSPLNPSEFGSRARIHVEKGLYEGGYLLRVYVRGIRPQDISVNADYGRIRLQSEMSVRRDWQDEYRRSRVSGYGSFVRNIPLPFDADASRMETTISEGVVQIRIPRR